jgi:hypothetical protein
MTNDRFESFSSPKLGPTRTYRERDAKLPFASELRKQEIALRPERPSTRGFNSRSPTRTPPESEPVTRLRPITAALVAEALTLWKSGQDGRGLVVVAEHLGVDYRLLKHRISQERRTDG